MNFPKGAIQYHLHRGNTKADSIYKLLNSSTEIDEIGAVEQILFSFPLCGRTIYKGISQFYTQPANYDICPLSSIWSSSIGHILADGSISLDEFYENLNSLRREVSKATDTNTQVLLPLSGGLDSRFIASCLDKSENVESFTYHSGPSSELIVAKKVACLHGIHHRAASLEPIIYCKEQLFGKHLGMVQHYHSALIYVALSLRHKYPEKRLLMPHGFMGDPVFGSKASYAKKLSMDEACEAFLNRALNRYSFFAPCIPKSILNAILDDLAKDYINYGARDSNSNFEEILFVTRRQQMIYKIVDLVDDIVQILTPFASNHSLINSALRLSLEFRISRNAFKSYLEKHSPLSTKINSENPWGLSHSVSICIRRICNLTQYIFESFNPEIMISPFLHEHLRSSVYSNLPYIERNINIFEELLNIDTSWKNSLNRCFNSSDFAYSCSTIGSAFNLIKIKGA